MLNACSTWGLAAVSRLRFRQSFAESEHTAVAEMLASDERSSAAALSDAIKSTARVENAARNAAWHCEAPIQITPIML